MNASEIVVVLTVTLVVIPLILVMITSRPLHHDKIILHPKVITPEEADEIMIKKFAKHKRKRGRNITKARRLLKLLKLIK